MVNLSAEWITLGRFITLKVEHEPEFITLEIPARFMFLELPARCVITTVVLTTVFADLVKSEVDKVSDSYPDIFTESKQKEELFV